MKQTPKLSPLFWASGIILSILLLSLNACHKKEVEPIICPEVDFRMEIDMADTLLRVDTVFGVNYNRVIFTASDLYETYHWTVGTDPRTWDTKSFALRFADLSGNFKITFVGQRKAMPECYPNETPSQEPVRDTIVKNLHVKVLNDPFYFPAPEPYIYEGTWEGAFTDDPDNVFEIYIVDTGPAEDASSRYGIRMFNFPPGCGDVNDWESSAVEVSGTYRHFGLYSDRTSDGCPWALRSSEQNFGSVYGEKNDSLLIYLGGFRPSTRMFKEKRK